MTVEYIIFLDWSNDELITKLKKEHKLDWWDIDEAVKGATSGKWVNRKKYGRRFRVETVIESTNRKIVVYLKPVNQREGDWVVKTAF